MGRDIVSKPQTGNTDPGGEPTVEFRGKDAFNIFQRIEDNGDVSFIGLLGALLTIIDGNIGGLIFGVQDISGLSIMEVYEDGTVVMGRPLFEDFKLDGPGGGVPSLRAMKGTGVRRLTADANGVVSATKIEPLVYKALITQSGTNAPTAKILENTLGFTPVYNYDSVGAYFINPTGVLSDPDKVAILMQNPDPTSGIVGTRHDGLQLNIYTTNSSLAKTNGILLDSLIRIEVYP